jgi:hypothetical protein
VAGGLKEVEAVGSTWGSFPLDLLAFLRRTHRMPRKSSTIAARPPMTPPIIAPMRGLLGVADGDSGAPEGAVSFLEACGGSVGRSSAIL